MKIVIDTNIVFSAILNTNARIAQIILQPKSKLNLYTTEQLSFEIQKHKDKIKKITGYTDDEIDRIIMLLARRIRFIDIRLVRKETLRKAEQLCMDVDINDTEFIALTEHLKGKFWSGDKALQKGLKKKKWNKFISTEELFQFSTKRRKTI